MTVQDDERERELVRAFGLTWNRDHQRAGIDAVLKVELDGRICEFEVEVKSSTGDTVSTARDVGMEHIEKWRRKLFVIGFYSRSSGRPELLRCLCLTPLDMEPWIASVESKIAIDFALASRASRKLELDDLFDVCGMQTTYAIADAKRLHKLQWTSRQYSEALDTTENGKPRISQLKMLEILRLRSQYIAQRGATLNNPHVTKTHLIKFAGTSREIQAPDWAASIRVIAQAFARARPDHPAVGW
jgi:hypothetical protein